ncbi:MAG: UDP-N-acetylmuramate--L-alanine ligase, partial [Actinomycetia bacterium]|nr:UDP-N-acetylmuramate--L-alanine ligase [Actinomycetes bacterium]
MSAIAHVLIKMGYKVAGSDIKESRYTKDLQKNGATIYLGHQKENINDSDIVVYSSAVPKNNVEVEEAKKRK